MPDHKQNAIKAFIRELKKTIDADRVYTDELRRLAWGADAGFYHLIPKVVVRAKNREEVSIILRMASDYHLPVGCRYQPFRPGHQRLDTHSRRQELGRL